MVGGVRVINVGSVGEAPARPGGACLHADATFLQIRPEWPTIAGLVEPVPWSRARVRR